MVQATESATANDLLRDSPKRRGHFRILQALPRFCLAPGGPDVILLFYTTRRCGQEVLSVRCSVLLHDICCARSGRRCRAVVGGILQSFARQGSVTEKAEELVPALRRGPVVPPFAARCAGSSPSVPRFPVQLVSVGRSFECEDPTPTPPPRRSIARARAPGIGAGW